MDLFLQIWGSSFYLLNKGLFALAEGKREHLKRLLKIIGWSVYLLGAPAWVIILAGKHDWIAAAITAGGMPSMLFGLYNVCRNNMTPNKRLDQITSAFTYGFLLYGLSYSLYDYGGITTLSQILEMGIMIGFLLGSYLLAKNIHYGWLFFMLMNASTGTLMLVQHKPLLSIQQFVSLCFVIYGFSVALQTSRKEFNSQELHHEQSHDNLRLE